MARASQPPAYRQACSTGLFKRQPAPSTNQTPHSAQTSQTASPVLFAAIGSQQPSTANAKATTKLTTGLTSCIALYSQATAPPPASIQPYPAQLLSFAQPCHWHLALVDGSTKLKPKQHQATPVNTSKPKANLDAV